MVIVVVVVIEPPLITWWLGDFFIASLISNCKRWVGGVPRWSRTTRMLGVIFQPNNKDEKTKDVVLYVLGFEFFDRASTGFKRNDHPLCIFEVRSFSHSTQPTPIHLTLHCGYSK